ncbi:unknown [Feldmannia species virus]|uniref:Uncharacterized protein n=1 Tax=Feldmannia species virus TaxID=39420 RepID=B5LWL6_9PHYC|nr:hypothetical protein FeldSpV_gp127 [Feldmannia species virus]ACH46879.1 unknown [Feldmannia species virus]
MSTHQQVLLYTAVLLGTVGAYGTLQSTYSSDSPEYVSDSKLKSDVDKLKNETSSVTDFIKSFQENSTSLHSRMSELENLIPLLGDSTKTSDSNQLVVISNSINAAKEVSYAARDKANTNSASIAQVKTSVDTLLSEFGEVASLNSSLVGLKDRLETMSLTGVRQQLADLELQTQGMVDRVTGVETWMSNRVNLSRDSSSSSGTISTDRMADIETLLDINSQGVVSLTGRVDSNTLDIATFVPDFQEQLSQNKANTANAKTLADTNHDTYTQIVTPRLVDLENSVLNLQSLDSTVVSRLEVLESSKPFEAAERASLSSDIQTVSSRSTELAEKIDAVVDELEGYYAERIDSCFANIELTSSSLSHLTDLLYRPSNVDEVRCDGYFRALNGAELSNATLSLAAPGDRNWMIYKAEGTTENGLVHGTGFDSFATRIRVFKSPNQGFIIENSLEKLLLSVRGSDGLTGIGGELQVEGTAAVYHHSGNACFGHWNQRGDKCALSQSSDGSVALGSFGTPNVNLKCSGVDRISISPSQTRLRGSVWIQNGATGEDTRSTVLNEDNNYLATGSGKKTYFTFGRNNPSVHVREKEINIDGVDVLAKLKELQDGIVFLENKVENEFVKKGSEYWMQGEKDNWNAELGYAGDDARWHKNNSRMKFKIHSA